MATAIAVAQCFFSLFRKCLVSKLFLKNNLEVTYRNLCTHLFFYAVLQPTRESRSEVNQFRQLPHRENLFRFWPNSIVWQGTRNAWIMPFATLVDMFSIKITSPTIKKRKEIIISESLRKDLFKKYVWTENAIELSTAQVHNASKFETKFLLIGNDGTLLQVTELQLALKQVGLVCNLSVFFVWELKSF